MAHDIVEQAKQIVDGWATITLDLAAKCREISKTFMSVTNQQVSWTRFTTQKKKGETKLMDLKHLTSFWKETMNEELTVKFTFKKVPAATLTR